MIFFHILSNNEKPGLKLASLAQISSFKDFLDATGLLELGLVDLFFT